MWQFNHAVLVLLKISSVVMFASWFLSCGTSKKIAEQTFEQKLSLMLDTSSVLSSGFTGLVLYDLDAKKLIFSRNEFRYFVPASNTKLFTLYACLHTLGDSIPALRYVETDTSFTFWGTADPTFLHPFFPASKTLDFLTSKAREKKLYYFDGHSSTKHYGRGWMWDDYSDYYQAELTPFPLFGNVLLVKKDSLGLTISPEISLERMVKKSGIKRVRRMMEKNHFDFPEALDTLSKFKQEVPYKDAANVNIHILEKMLGTKITKIGVRGSGQSEILFSLPVDTVYRRMMQVSDNMLAEHLLLLCGASLKDTISTAYSIDTVTSSLLSDLSHRPEWVDGAGLSRYNLTTPMSIVTLLQKMYQELPEEKLFSMLAEGGGQGTLNGMFNEGDKPFIYAKSGSMSGVYNLSGYMVTRSGKRLIFSFMNNNFNTSVSGVRKEVDHILTEIKGLK
jgi:serine-type D-Ala-D-Ala carboxypeptidase/endopeptidase (penicillin-binding protein 4)